MSFRKPNISTKITAEEQRLSKEHHETQRRVEQLEKELRSYPRKIEEKKAQDRKLVQMRVAAAPAAMSLGGARASRSHYPPSHKQKKLPSREFHSARIKFLGLCLILATIIFMLWRSIPS